ncbi:tRNA (adenosine(37)-N6)-dimethylallyltransferase MiaA [Butyrivibrio sp. WCD3002]|uniref:tRNA (adenosine(37)-N6)-dimethylallyltransferase MiaA n=1 Tax=Butyrivibrio sp. WCD3002 TaxID=1280676 RepID=UPI00040DD454|nr:tRNA (adenosine(37)-N6)-dimethylallyltransferase MiaA [Butyrivibrio sp. WCD3002]
MDKEKLIILTGPTAVGKTKISIGLAKRIGGEIISADSMQVYKGMDIGTDKIKPEKMQGVPHHMIDILEPSEDFNAFEFKRRAKEIIKDIISRGKIPILVGGTGFYIQSVLYDVDFEVPESSEESSAYRQELEAIAKTPEGVHRLYEELCKVDPEYTQDLHENNVKRVIRALCFYKDTGERMSEHNKQQRENESPYDFFYFVLTDDRDVLYDRIEKRIDMMMEEGLVDEVRDIMAQNISRDATSMQALGYREMLSYLNGELSLEEATDLLKKNTRHFAKRQLTWFRREKTVTFIDKKEYGRDDDLVLDAIVDMIKDRWSNLE